MVFSVAVRAVVVSKKLHFFRVASYASNRRYPCIYSSALPLLYFRVFFFMCFGAFLPLLPSMRSHVTSRS
jgi:hypothetical protein